MICKKKSILILAVVSALVISLTACGSSEVQDSAPQINETFSASATESSLSAAEPETAAAEAPAETSKSDAPTAEDAKAYVKAVLDILCTGDYDHSVDLSDIPEGEEAQLRDSTIESAVEAIASDAGLSEEVKADFTDVMRVAFSKAKYTVGEAVPTEDGGYDVTVTIEPLEMYAGAADKLPERVSQDELAGLSEEESNNLIYSKVIEIVRENLEEPEYGEPQDIIVHYGIIDEQNNLWGVSEEEGEKLGALLFSADME